MGNTTSIARKSGFSFLHIHLGMAVRTGNGTSAGAQLVLVHLRNPTRTRGGDLFLGTNAPYPVSPARLVPTLVLAVLPFA